MKTKTLDLQKLHELELLAYGERGCPGTTLSRTMVDNKLLTEWRIKVPEDRLDRESTIVWCLAVGYLMEPKVFYYGLTPDECLEKAWTEATKRADKKRVKFVMDTLAKERAAEGREYEAHVKEGLKAKKPRKR